MRRAVTVLVATVAVAAIPVAALGHEGGISDARPRPGALVGGTLTKVQLLFEQDVLTLDGAVVRVFDPLDDAVEVHTLSLPVSSLLEAEIAPPSDVGSYLVEYEVASVSGQVHTGRYVFLFDPLAEPVEFFPLDRFQPGWPILVLVATILAAFACIVGAWRSGSGEPTVEPGAFRSRYRSRRHTSSDRISGGVRTRGPHP
ncbi:MAG: copper resistance protein CopC [Acidimicrobiia bacterium]